MTCKITVTNPIKPVRTQRKPPTGPRAPGLAEEGPELHRKTCKKSRGLGRGKESYAWRRPGCVSLRSEEVRQQERSPQKREREKERKPRNGNSRAAPRNPPRPPTKRQTRGGKTLEESAYEIRDAAAAVRPITNVEIHRGSRL